MSEEDRERREQEASARLLIEKRHAERRAARLQMRTSEDAPVAKGSVELSVEPLRQEPTVLQPGEESVGFSRTFVGQTEALKARVPTRRAQPTGEVESAVVTDVPADHAKPVAEVEPRGGEQKVQPQGEPDRYIWTKPEMDQVRAERETQEAVPQAVPHPELSGEARAEAVVPLDAAIRHLHDVADQIAVEPLQKPVLEVAATPPAPVAEMAETPVLQASTVDGGMPVELPMQEHEVLRKQLADLERENQEKRVRLAREREERKEQEQADALKRVGAMRDRWAANEAARQAARDAEAKERSLQNQRLATEAELHNAALTSPIDHKDGKDFRAGVVARLGTQRNLFWAMLVALLILLWVQILTYQRVGDLATSGSSQANPVLKQELTALRGEITKLGGQLPDGWKMECRLARLVKDGEESYVYQGCFPVPVGME